MQAVPVRIAATISNLNIKNKDKDICVLMKKDPVICKSIQPWRAYKPEQYEQMIDDFMSDLEGSVYKHFYNYRHFNYTAEEAFQDAYEAIVICLEKDKQPPTIVKEAGFKCPGCAAPVPGTSPQDSFELPDTAGMLTASYPSDTGQRVYSATCTECNFTWTKTVTKAQFASLFFGQVRGKIQNTVRNTALKLPSWDTLKESSGSLNEPSTTIDFESSDETAEDIMFMAKLAKRIHDIIEETMTPRHAEILRLRLNGRMANGEPLQQSDIAKLLNISKQRVCNILNTKLKAMRSFFNEEDMLRYAQIMRKR